MAGPGRPAREPMERLVRLMAALWHAGEAGVEAATLVRVAGFKDGDPISQLKRDFNHLGRQGWQIDNIAPPGLPARYRMVKGDNRLRLRLTPDQRAALQRAALLADRGDLVTLLGLPPDTARPATRDLVLAAHDGGLSVIVRAVRTSALLRFRYKGCARTVQPASLKHQNGQWYFSGIELGDEVVKHFVVSRMRDVEADAPGSAPRVPEPQLRLHPLFWEFDPPTEVVLRTSREYAPDVVRWLTEPREQRPEGDDVVMTYVVTHRRAMRARLHVLGHRVQVLGCEDFRAELLEELREMAGA